MKLEIEFDIQHVHNALEYPHSKYWTNEVSWDPDTCSGYVVDVQEDGEPHILLNRGSIRAGLQTMVKEHPCTFGRIIAGETDGVDGDTLLQYMAFGECKY